jgi:hypothetical protein
MEIIFTQIETFVTNLEWSYIITFILITWLLSRDNALESWWKEDKMPKLRSFAMAIPKSLRVAILGSIYAVIHFYVYDLAPNKITALLESFITAVAFHGLILKGIQKKFGI